jgi:hypothetical protein
MTKPTIQIGDEVREMTDAENDQYNLDLAEFEAQAKADKAKAKARQIVLDRLGITAAEAQLLRL